MLEWKPISERIIKARYSGTVMSTRHLQSCVIVCYAPTESAKDEEKDTFYDELQASVNETPSHDVLLTMGDLNAKVGIDNQGKESTIGRQGLGDANDNGDRVTTFCQENRLVIGGTIFEHKNVHKETWCSPDGHTQNHNYDKTKLITSSLTTDGGVVCRMRGQDGEQMLEVIMLLSKPK